MLSWMLVSYFPFGTLLTLVEGWTCAGSKAGIHRRCNYLLPAGSCLTFASQRLVYELFKLLLPDGEVCISAALALASFAIGVCEATWQTPFVKLFCFFFFKLKKKVKLFLAWIRSLILFTTLPAHVVMQPGGREMCQRCRTIFQHQRGRFSLQKFGVLIGNSVIWENAVSCQ